MTEFPNSHASRSQTGASGAGETFTSNQADSGQGYSEHWTDEQFSNYMLGLQVDPVAMQHLALCTVCQGEADQFQSSIESFNDLTLEWSERQPYARALIPEEKPGFAWLPAASWAMAAAVVFTVGLPMVLQHHASMEDRPAVVSPVQSQIASIADENSDAAIERDNKLMMAVAVELDRPDTAAAASLVNEPKTLGMAARRGTHE